MQKPKSGIVSAILFAALIFVCVSILVSYWMGFAFLSIPVVVGISLPVSFFLWKKFSLPSEKIPLPVLFSALLVAAICAFPLLLVTPYYMGSNDAFHTITLRTLSMAGRIPETYAPYSGVSFTYQIGFHLFAKILTGLFFFVEDFLVLWAFGVLLAAIEAILVFLVSRELFKSDSTAIWASILFIGAKTTYINMYFGMFPRMLGSCLILFFFYLFLKKNKLAFLVVPAMLMVHIAWTINGVLLLLVFVAFNKDRFFDMLKTVPFAALAFPAFLMNLKIYTAHFSRILIGKTTSISNPIQSINMLSFTFAYLLSMGWAIGLLFGTAFVYSIIKKRVNKIMLFSFSVFLAGSLMYYFAALAGLTIENELPWLFTLGAIFFTSITLDGVQIKAKNLKFVKIIIVLLLLFGFATSSYVTARISGSKISRDEAAFAFKFKEFDPELKTVVFLGMASAKTAELSNKIPFNAGQGWFLPFDERLVVHDKAYYDELQKIQVQKKIVEEKCAECVLDLNVDYAAINTENFPALPGRKPVLEYGSIKLYRLH
ncbi:MAG: hypothetical protein QXK06_02950 [Candidatus Diapherotrites archaeon]